MDLLASKVDDTNHLHVTQLEAWYKEYANMRGNPTLFKPDVDPSHYDWQWFLFEILIPIPSDEIKSGSTHPNRSTQGLPSHLRWRDAESSDHLPQVASFRSTQ